MRSFQRPRQVTVGFVAVTMATALVACSSDSSENDSHEEDNTSAITQEDIDRLSSGLEEANNLQHELRVASQRLFRQCMEDEGFTYHPEPPRSESDLAGTVASIATPGSEPPNMDLLPDTDTAMADGAGVHDEWRKVNSDDYQNPHTQSAPEFEAQGREYSDDYFDTANGSQDIALDYEDMSEDELEEALQELDGEESGANGCYGEVNHHIYGADIEEFDQIDPELIPTTSLPPLPEGMDLSQSGIDHLTPALQEAKDEWNSCMVARDEPEVSEFAMMHEYLKHFYSHQTTTEEIKWATAHDNLQGQATLEWIDPPAESPWEFEEAKEREINFMTNVAECADEAELRETRQQEWNLTLTEIALVDEQGLFLWAEQLAAAVDRAQVLLAE